MRFFKSISGFNKSLLNSMGEGVVVVGEKGECRFMNPEAERLLGYKKDDLLGKSIYLTWFKNGAHREGCNDDACPVEATLSDKKNRSGECVFLHKDNITLPVQCVASPFVEDGQITGIVVSFFDISEKKQLDRIAAENKGMLEVEFENLPVGCIIWSDQFTAITWNPMCQKIFGYTAREAFGKKPFDLFVPKNAPEAEVSIWKNIPSEKSTIVKSTTNRTKDGIEIFCQWNLTRLVNPNGTLVGVLSTVEDTTERVIIQKELHKTLEDLRTSKEGIEKKIEERTQELAEAKAKEEAIFASIGEGIAVVDKHHEIIFANDAFSNLVGIMDSGLIGKNVHNVLFLEDSQNGSVSKEVDPITKTILTNKQILSSDYNLNAKRKSAVFPVFIATSPMIFNKEPIGVVVAVRDITKEKELDKAKSDFVSIASHQLRTPLSSIRWVLDVLREETLTPKQKEYVENLYASNQRLVNLVDDLLNTSRIESGNIQAKKVSVSLKDTVNTFVNTFIPSAEKKKQTIKLTIKAKPDTVTIDTKLFEMAFVNMLSNAISYSPENLPITIEVKSDAQNCTVSVNNREPVIPDADKEKIFTKFYRADTAKKIRPEGTGLGVFIAKSSIETSGGKMWFDSNVKDGTTFYFTIPVV